MRRPLVLIALVLLAALAAAGRAAAADQVTLRPTSGGEYAYNQPEAPPVVGRYAVIHYVTSGPDAPSQVDADGNGLPDYVAEVAAAADTSLGYYSSHGFRLPNPDTAGPDAKTDIYIHKLQEGLFGVTYAATYAEGGTFVVVSPTLDPATNGKAVGSLYGTLAHELFHAVQYAYVPNGEMPAWAAEGQASAMAMLVYPQIRDEVMEQYLGAWLKQAYRPLYDQRSQCDHCYGGVLWWYSLAKLDPDAKVVSTYLGRLYGYQQAGRPLLAGTQPLDEALAQLGHGSLAKVYTRFSLKLYQEGLNPGTRPALHTGSKLQTTKAETLDGLSTHYVPVQVGAGARTLQLGLASAGPAPQVTLVVGGPRGRVIDPKLSRQGHLAQFQVEFRSAAERSHVMLIVTSGHQDGDRYRIAYAAS
jgi:hypothetical protein